MRKRVFISALLIAASGLAYGQSARDYIYVVGSSTVYPFATVVAEQFGRSSDYPTPKIESTGSGGGLKLFCAGVGVKHPDITNASRRIKQSEVDNCAGNGVIDIIEVKIGYDGIVLANAIDAPVFELSLRDIYLALAKQVPNPDGSDTLIDNPYRYWSEVNAKLPATRIQVIGPPPTSGTRDAFVELAMEGGCKTFAFVKAMKKSDQEGFQRACQTMREDGAFIEAGENDNLIVQKLIANPDAVGIFGFSFLDQNMDKVKGASVNGSKPTFELIAKGRYPVSRPLYFYVKKDHIGVIPGIREYLAEFTSEKAWGEEGYLSDRGLIPMPEQERMEVSVRVESLRSLRLVDE